MFYIFCVFVPMCDDDVSLVVSLILFVTGLLKLMMWSVICLQCFGAVGWVAGRAFGLKKN